MGAIAWSMMFGVTGLIQVDNLVVRVPCLLWMALGVYLLRARWQSLR